MRRLLLAALTALILPAAALAQTPPEEPDPRDEEIFGSEEPDPPKKTGPTDDSEPPEGDDPRDDDIFGGDDDAPNDKPTSRPSPDDPFNEDPGIENRLMGKLMEQDDPLQIGGFLYIRPSWSFVDSPDVEDHPISMPNLLELYLDGRPSDRVRAFVRGRLNYDPTAGAAQFGGLFPAADEVSVDLVQFWLNFDIARVVYVTVGQLQIRWGTSRVWNPIDVLNQVRRDPTAPFDPRIGIPALKLHFPVESLGWNFYVIGLLDDVTSIDKAGVAGRAEFVVETAEFAVSSVYRDGVDPKLGFDWSIGVWDLDITGEVGLTFGDKLRCTTDAAGVEACDEELDPWVQVSVGIEYGIKYNDDDTMFLGLEYFYNQRGHDSIEKAIYTAAGVQDADQLIGNVASQFIADPTAGASAFTGLLGGLEFFYIGKHYGAFLALFPSPGDWDTGNLTFSTLGNFSDRSFISRLDVSWTVLTYLQIQMFVQVAYGMQGELRIGSGTFGEINSAWDQFATGANALLPTDQQLPTGNLFQIPTQVATVGLWLRLDI